MRKGTIIIFLILLVLISSGCITDNKSTNNKEAEDIISFFMEYNIAIMNIQMAREYLATSQANLDIGVDYILSEEYTYVDAENIFDEGKEQTLKANEYLTKSIKKLEKIKENTPNSFFKQDIENRIKQTNLLISISDDYYLLLDYLIKELYEVNYGSSLKAKEYNNKYNDLIPKIDSTLNELSAVQSDIDLEWDQDWFPSYRSTPESVTKYL